MYWGTRERIISNLPLGPQPATSASFNPGEPTSGEPRPAACDTGCSTFFKFSRACALRFIAKQYSGIQLVPSAVDPPPQSTPSSYAHTQQPGAPARRVREIGECGEDGAINGKPVDVCRLEAVLGVSGRGG